MVERDEHGQFRTENPRTVMEMTSRERIKNAKHHKYDSFRHTVLRKVTDHNLQETVLVNQIVNNSIDENSSIGTVWTEFRYTTIFDIFD